MTTAVVRALSPTRSRVLTVVVFLSMLFGFYGLLSAQQARSATPNATLSKQVWGGIRWDGTIAHQKHITSVSHGSTGKYTITFDRHVDNCALEVTVRAEGGATNFTHFELSRQLGFTTSQILVTEVSATAASFVDSDFDIFGMCPSS